MRVYAAGTPRRLVGSALVDTGSGYDSQSDVPVHVGVGIATDVVVEVTYPSAGRADLTRATVNVPSQSSRIVQLGPPRIR